ncbi:MAG: tRNA (adenosine(37)-N6)-threonylcarbamoyltransferase complex transferase subunit TsaD [Thermodesulfobacteriota bacterium]
MLVLGIESSCDDTAAAVVEDGRVLWSSVVSSQDSIHSKYGGIVPELASRRHIEAIIPVVEEALHKAGVNLDSIDGIAVTQGPGLVGSILIGLSFAKALSYARKIPLTAVNHIVAHPFAAFLGAKGGSPAAQPDFPLMALVVSGGHTTLIRLDSYLEYEVLGRTIDDAAGEAFDKSAKLLGLGYPGGPVMDRLAREGSREAFYFKRPYLKKGSLDFSFSGIKTAVLRHVDELKKEETLGESAIRDLSASFQEAVVDVLLKKAFWALEAWDTPNLILAGGVACNSRLRERALLAGEEKGLNVTIPEKKLCSDNAAFVASAGYWRLKDGRTEGLDLNAIPSFFDF